MKRNKHKMLKIRSSLITTSLIGVVVALLLSTLFIALFSNLILNGAISDSNTRWFVFLSRGIGLFVGTLMAGAILREQYLKLAGLVLAGYLLILVGIGIIFYDGSFKGFASGVTSLALGSVIAFVILQGLTNKRKKRPKIRI